jgi:predicted Zn-dependent protease
MRKVLILLCIVVIFLSGCATTGSNIKYYEDHKDSQWLKDSAARFRVNMKQFPAIANRRMMVRVFSWNDVPNAFINFDNRYIVISISDTLLPHLKGNNIYCLLAHECAHAEFYHQGTQSGVSALISVTFLIAESAVPGYGIGLFNPLAQSIVVNAYSRKDELTADARALDYLAEMGIPNTDFVAFLKLVKSIQPLAVQGGGIFDTHPNYNERIENVENRKIPIKSNITEVVISAKQAEEQEAKDEALKVKEIKNKFNFDIGPYGEAKATKLKEGLTERDIRTLFDEYNPNEKKILDKEKTIWAYNISGTKYRFFILLQKDNTGISRVADFTIDSAASRLNEVKFNQVNAQK